MAQPQRSTLHIDAALTNFSKAFSNRGNQFIASKLFPRVRVGKQSDKYFIYGNESLRLAESVREPGTPFKRYGFTLSNTSYYCEQVGREHAIPWEDRDSADPAINLDQDSVQMLTDQIDLELENRLASLITTSNITQNTTLTTNYQWNNYDSSTSDPEKDIKTAKVTIQAATGRAPNTIVMGYQVAENLAHHPTIVELRKYTSPEFLNDAGLPSRLFGLNVLLANAVYDNTKQGQATSLAELWGKNVLVAYVDPNPGLRSITLGVTFEYGGRVVEKYEEQNTRSDIIRVLEQGIDEAIIAASCGYLIVSAIA